MNVSLFLITCLMLFGSEPVEETQVMQYTCEPIPEMTPEPMPEPTPEEIIYVLTQRENLTKFLAEDPTDEKEWNESIDYVCMDFAIDLGYNLTDAGFEAGCVSIVSKYRDVGMWHFINWVKIGNETVYIEPQDDNTFDPDEYMEMINASIHFNREIPISSAERNRAEMRSWR